LDNAAHAELLDREVYRTPLVVAPDFEFRPTPDNYRETYQGQGKLPDRIKVWRVQNSPRGNMVSPSSGFLDSPDAEIIAVGFNLAKEYGAIGIGRQADFLQWGYGDPPSQMTEAGRRLFINCIHYIHRFDGQTPLVRRRAEARDSAVLVASALARIHRFVTNQVIYVSPPKRSGTSGRGTEATSVPLFGPDPWLPFETPRTVRARPGEAAHVLAPQKQFFLKMFAPDLWDRYCADPNSLAAYYKASLELIYWDGIFRVDDDLKSLGIESNRKVQTLECLFELRKDEPHRELAQKLIDRYTDGPTEFDFQNGRDRIYFTDTGGYKFKVMPEGYLTAEAAKK
jgi:hypothetical protein